MEPRTSVLVCMPRDKSLTVFSKKKRLESNMKRGQYPGADESNNKSENKDSGNRQLPYPRPDID